MESEHPVLPPANIQQQQQQQQQLQQNPVTNRINGEELQKGIHYLDTDESNDLKAHSKPNTFADFTNVKPSDVASNLLGVRAHGEQVVQTGGVTPLYGEHYTGYLKDTKIKSTKDMPGLSRSEGPKMNEDGGKIGAINSSKTSSALNTFSYDPDSPMGMYGYYLSSWHLFFLMEKKNTKII